MGKKLIALVAIIFALSFSSLSFAQTPNADEIYSEQGPFMAPMEPDPGIPDTVTAESKTIPSGTTDFTLNVTLYNDEELGGFNLPITWSSPDITCDSVSFVGTRVEYVNTKLFSVDNVNQRLQAGIIIFFEQYLQPGNGIIYTAYFTVAPGASDQVIDIDSIFYPPGGNFALTLTNGFNTLPQFVAGTVTMGNPTAPEIALDPTTFAFSGTEGEANPPSQTLNISNSGTGTLEWSLASSSGWLNLNPTSGTDDGAIDVSVSLAGLSAGTYYDTIVVTANSDNSPQTVPVTLVVEAPPPIIQLDPTNIEVTVIEGGSLPSDQIAVTNTGGGTLDWSTANLTGWITLDPTSGIGDGTITLNYNLTGVTAGIYYDTITVSDPNAANNPQKAAVTLTVEPPPPTIQLDPVNISITADEGSTPPSEQITVTNIGGGTLDWTATNLTGWIALNPISGVGDGTISLDFDLTGVSAGTYYDTITISDPNATNDPQFTAVMLTVEALSPTIQLDPVSIEVTAAEESSPPSEQITITNTGGGTLNWSATNQTGWLSLSPPNGVGDGIITVEFDLTGLTPGIYYDTVVVSDESATNSPQITSVMLTIEAEADPEIGLSHTLFTFNATEGGGNPPSQTLTIANLGGGVLNWTAEEVEGWLTLNPESGTGDGTVEVSVDATGLTQGTYIDTILVIDPDAINSPQAVGVLLTISDFAFGTAIIYPEAQHVIQAYAINPKTDTIYIGNFGSYSVNDIDPASVVINGSLVPVATSVIPSHPDFTGEVMEIIIEARPFILGYGILYDTSLHEFMVSGLFNDQTIFEAAGEVTFYGHISGDVNRDGIVDVGDPVYIIEFIFREGETPDPIEIADVNCDGRIDIGDARFLINYVFREGPKPNCQQ